MSLRRFFAILAIGVAATCGHVHAQTNTIDTQPLAVNPSMSDEVLSYQPTQSPHTRKMTLEQILSLASAAPGIGTAARYNVGTSGGVVPLLSGANTWLGTQVFSSATILGGSVAGYIPTGGAATDLGPAAGAVLGVWPNLSFAPSPSFQGLPQVRGSVAAAQLEFVRGGTGYTFVGATQTAIGVSSSEALPFQIALNGYQTYFYIDPTFGNVGIGTTSPQSRLDVNAQSIRIETAYTPASSATACSTGQIAWDTSFVYVCVSTNTWKRSTLGSF